MSPRGGLLATRQNRLLAAAAAAGLLLAMLWAFGRLSESKGAAATAAGDLGRCQALAATIQSLRGRPALADVKEARATDVSRRVEEAARAAEFPDGSLDRIEPEPP